MKALAGFVALGMRSAIASKPVLVVGLATYLMLLGVYAGIYALTPFDELDPALEVNFATMVWYITITELLIIPGSSIFRQIRDEIIGGGFYASLSRPFGYLGMRAGLGNGEIFVMITGYLLFGVAFSVLVTGHVPGIVNMIWLLGCLVMSALILNFVNFMVGLVQVWGNYAQPCFWIIQKFNFLFGGLMIPLFLYPDWLEKLAYFTPFPSILYAPAACLFDHMIPSMPYILMMQFVWLVVVIGLAWGMHRLAVHKMMKGGV